VSEPIETARALGFRTVVTGVRFPFCAMNASDCAGTADEIRALRRSRTGAIVLKTMTVHPFVHPGFRSLHNPGFDKLLPFVRELAADRERPVVASIAGATPEELGFLAKAFADAGASIVEANLAEPYVESTLAAFDDPDVLHDVAVRLAAAGRPVWVKLPEQVRIPYAPLVAILVDAGVRGVVAHNDFHGYEKLMLEAPSPIDVVVGGGIASGFDVTTAMRKGAKAVQVGSALRSEGPGIFARLEREMRRFAGTTE
jgi:dihydroorotate dehydrogenase